MRINPDEKQKIFKQVKHRLGAPIRKIQLEEEQMDSLLEIATEDYIEFIQIALDHGAKGVVAINSVGPGLVVDLKSKSVLFPKYFSQLEKEIEKIKAKTRPKSDLNLLIGYRLYFRFVYFIIFPFY